MTNNFGVIIYGFGLLTVWLVIAAALTALFAPLGIAWIIISAIGIYEGVSDVRRR